MPRVDSYSANVEGLRLTFPSALLGHRADRDSGACEIDLGSGLHDWVTESSRFWASILREDWRECSLPASSRYRARHWPSGRFAMFAG